MMKLWQYILICFLVLSSSLALQAQTRSQFFGNDLTQQAQTLYIRGASSLTAFESEAAASKETLATFDYQIGGWLGESRLVGFQLAHREDDVAFELNDSRSKSMFTDLKLQGRIWWFVPSIGLSLSEVEVSLDDETTVGLYSTGFNAGLGVMVSIYPGVVVSGDVMLVRSGKVHDKLDQDTKLGDRSEIDVHIAFDITEHLVDLIVGYNIRQYEIELTDLLTKEHAQGAYIGLRLGVYF